MVDNGPADDEVEIELRSRDDVAKRGIVLLSTVQRIGIDTGPAFATPTERATAAFDLREWLRGEGLWGDLTPSESAFLGGSGGDTTLDFIAEQGSQAEAVAVMAWALGLLDTLSDLDYSDIEPVLSAVPSPWDAIAPWIESLTMRPEAQVARRREQAEIWEWRLSMEPYRRMLEGRELMDLEHTIRDVTRDGQSQGLLLPGKKGGFAVYGRPIPALDPIDVDELAAIANERLYALNWVCGYGDTWDDVPLEI